VTLGRGRKSAGYVPTGVAIPIRENPADRAVLNTTSHWFGVTYPEDKPHVVASIQQLIAAGEYPQNLC